MKKILTIIIAAVFVISLMSTALAAPLWKNQETYVRGILVIVDGKDYYLAGEPVGDGTDVPGHSWKMTGPNTMVGLHVNTGPGGMANGWSSDAVDGALLYTVEGKIDTWSKGKSERYARIGFVHYHELVSAEDGMEHPRKVLWLRHTSAYATSFELDVGPHIWMGGAPPAPYEHTVDSGIDYGFPNNYMNPYSP